MDLADYDHPSLRTAAGTFLGYGLVIISMFLLLFVVPYLVFAAF